MKVVVALIFALSAATAACGNERASGARSEHVTTNERSLLQEGALQDALSALRGEVPGPIQALHLVVHPRRIILQARNPKDPNEVLQHVYERGRVEPPVRVRLEGPGKLDDNLFPLDAAKLSKIPDLARAAAARAGARPEDVRLVELARNLPESMDIEFRIQFRGKERNRPVRATFQGEIIEN